MLYIIMSSEQKESFASSCSIWMDFFLTTLHKTTSTVVDKSGNKGNLSLVPDLKEKVCRLSSPDMMLTIVFHRCPYEGEEAPFYSLFA